MLELVITLLTNGRSDILQQKNDLVVALLNFLDITIFQII